MEEFFYGIKEEFALWNISGKGYSALNTSGERIFSMEYISRAKLMRTFV